ncbi:MAG: MiaB/RimO family radical SAM methylthiotransferase [Desulfosalsimonadaceae bacterium]
MKVYLHNLGCARNIVDGEAMLGRLERAGHTLTDDADEAEAIVVNTCGFIDAAAEESVDAILELAGMKRTGACKRLIVTGCLPQRYQDDLPDALPEVDAFLGTGAYDRVVPAISGEIKTGACMLPDPASIPLHTRHTMRVQTTYPVAYVKVMEGCNRRCTYCIIPKLRGRLRSRPLEDIIDEAAALAQAGFPEIVLIGQDTTSYGEDLGSGANLAQLVSATARAVPMAWVRFLYGHPDRIDDDLLKAIRDNTNTCSYFDIPIQHVSPSVLKRMGRGSHGEEFFEALFERIRKAVPHRPRG